MRKQVDLNKPLPEALKEIERWLNHLLGVGQNVEIRGGRVTGISPGTSPSQALTLARGSTGLDAGSDGLRVKANVAAGTQITAAGLGVKVDGKTIKINSSGQLYVSLATQSKLKESGKSEDSGLMVDDTAMGTAYSGVAHAAEHVTGGSDVISNAIAATAAGLMSATDKTKLDGIPTLGTAATKNIPATGNASATEVVYGSDTRLSDSRAPTSHGNAAHSSTFITAAGIYAVGDVIITTTATNPSGRFGGTWTQRAQGQFLVGQKTGDSNFATSGSTGGSLSTSASTTNFTDVPAGGSRDMARAEHYHTYVPPFFVVYLWERTA